MARQKRGEESWSLEWGWTLIVACNVAKLSAGVDGGLVNLWRLSRQAHNWGWLLVGCWAIYYSK